METLQMLEQKIMSLVEFGKQLKDENVRLKEENVVLKQQVEHLENTLLTNREQAHQEQEVTQLVLADLIKGIDSVIEGSY